MAKKKRFRCQECGRRFGEVLTLARHAKKVHHGIEKIKKAKALTAPQDPKLVYAFARVQGFLHAYAEGIGISGDVFADRVGELLCAASRRTIRGAEQHLPLLQRSTAQGIEI